jgi:hypothetical protein
MGVAIDEQLKRIISEPFDFHHLTHTSPAHFEALDNAHDLVTEFSAIRASQKPVTELKGIRAEDIEFYNFSSEDLTDTTRSGSRCNAQSPPPPGSLSSPNTPPKSPSAKEARVAENFSRPVSRLNKPLPSTPSIIPPPRLSSRQAVSDIPEPTSQVIDEILGLNQPPTMPDFAYSFIDDGVDETSSLEQINLADVFHPDVGHAFTADDDAKPISTAALINSYLSDLEDVPEEDETNMGHGTTMIDSRPSTSQSLPGQDSIPATVTSDPPAKEQRQSSAVPQRLSFSEALMSPTLPQFNLTLGKSPGSQAEDGTKRHSRSKRAVDCEDFLASWDEDIDYCYEHAAESNCNFDWHRNSLEIPKVAMAGVSATAPEVQAQLEQADAQRPLSPRSLFPLRTTASAPATPDLDPGSAQSVLTRSHEAITPLSEGDAAVDIFAAPHHISAHDDYFEPVDSELLSAAIAKDMDRDAMYEEFLAGDDDADRRFAFYQQRRSQSSGDLPVSPRSSYSPISKYNSQESVILSRAASIVRKHRSSTSTASVPELVPSANSSRENTIRGSMGSVEQGTFVLIPDSIRQGLPSYHRQTKSLVPDLGSSSCLRATRSSGSIDVIDVPSSLASPSHDRTKSVSALEFETSRRIQRAEGLPFAARMQSASLAQRRKSRASYSLFPGAMAASQRR